VLWVLRVRVLCVCCGIAVDFAADFVGAEVLCVLCVLCVLVGTAGAVGAVLVLYWRCVEVFAVGAVACCSSVAAVAGYSCWSLLVGEL
jgi:hypothetical protein